MIIRDYIFCNTPKRICLILIVLIKKNFEVSQLRFVLSA